MVAEFATSAAANAVGNLAIEYASPYVNYFFRFSRIMEEFKNQRKELELKKERLKQDVDEAVRQTEVIYKDVEDWLTMAEKELGEAQALEDETERYKCFNWCPSWGWRYCLSKKVAKKTLCIKRLVDTCNFQRLGQRRPLQGIEFLPSKDYKASQSSTVAFNAIIKALTTDGVNMIGLYGMPGVGKTTLAKEVGKYIIEQKLFDKAVMVTISQTPNISKIQHRIAEILGLKFEAITEEGKAEELWRRLKGEKILIIIDDVWNEFKLETIGNQYDGENEVCKILLTTRLQQVCIQMNCQKKFELKILEEDETWALFKDIASLEDFSPTKLIEVAKDLAAECQGLPLAIITVAKSLKGQRLDAWEAANKRLKDSRHLDNQRVVGNIFNCLGLSYDYLTGDKTKSCFLLCSLFPEDYDIPIDRLTLIGIGEGLFCNIELMEEQRREIRLVLIELQQSGLLLEINDKKDTVRMHDVVRDFAHWLTTTGDTKFMVKDELTKWSMSENLESYSALAIWNLNIKFFPDKLEFKKLNTLILSGDKYDMLTIPAIFFEGMKALKVLWLEGVEFSLEVLQFLTNLRVLLLLDCQLINKNISSLIKAEKLEILLVDGAFIDKLSEEFGSLRHLKYLLFREDIKFPSNLLLRLTSLQELHVLGRNNINLWELSSLSCLTALSLNVSSELLPEGFVFPKLQSYCICVNEDPTYSRQTLKMLKIRKCSSSLRPFKELFCNVETLIFRSVSGFRYVVSNEEARGLNELISLELLGCHDLEYLIEPIQCHANAIKSLQSLKVVEIQFCKKLKFIFSPCVARNLLHLQQLVIRNCDELEQLFGFAEDQHQEENQPGVLSSLIKLELTNLPNLRSIWSGSTHLVNFSSLENLTINECHKLAYLFSSSLAHTLVHLKFILIRNCDILEHLISTEAEDGDAFCWPNLETLAITYCKSLKDLFPITLAQGLPVLEFIRIYDCPELTGLFNVTEENDELSPRLQFLKSQSLVNLKTLKISSCRSLKPVFSISLAQEFPALQNIEIDGCDELWQVFAFTEDVQIVEQGPTYLVNLSSLNTLEIRHCNKLECFTSSSLAQTLVNLEHLSIERCEGLEHLISMEARNGEAFCWPKLKHLSIVHCQNLKYVFPITLAQGLPSLENIKIYNCPRLMGLFNVSKENDELSHHKESLQSLKVLKIRECNGLKYVLSASLAQSLVQLQQIHIYHCNQVERIISEAESNGEIGSHSSHDVRPFLPHLQDLHLNSMENLCSFSSQKSPINLPCLNKLKVEYCPRLVNFNIQNKGDEQAGLKELIFNNSGYGMISINQPKHNSNKLDYATILEIFQIQDGQLLSKVESIKLYHMNQLRGPIHVASLQYLRELIVWNCNGLKSVFSPTLARNLPQLTFLQILKCDELEEIIDTTSASFSSSSEQAEAHLPHKYFPNLESLQIDECENLKSLFPVSVIPSLSKIKTIQIDGASKLEELFKYEAELDISQDDQNHKRMLLPNLENFVLSLSGLRSLVPRGYHLLFPSSCDLYLSECPKLTTSFSRDSKGVVHAITKAQPSQYLQNDSTKGFTTIEDISCRTVLPLYIEEEEREVAVVDI